MTMKKLILTLTAAATLALPMAASAAPWQSINQRQANLYNRIEQGVRNGSLTRPEARQLRERFGTLERLENRYRAGGLSAWERRDLDQRFDALSRQIRNERHDRQDRRYR
jgi:Ni/Co efflux regulator RcnB